MESRSIETVFGVERSVPVVTPKCRSGIGWRRTPEACHSLFPSSGSGPKNRAATKPAERAVSCKMRKKSVAVAGSIDRRRPAAITFELPADCSISSAGVLPDHYELYLLPMPFLLTCQYQGCSCPRRARESGSLNPLSENSGRESLRTWAWTAFTLRQKQPYDLAIEAASRAMPMEASPRNRSHHRLRYSPATMVSISLLPRNQPRFGG